MDNELLELCEEVYEKTGWTVTPNHIDIAYNSDFLLEKLPNGVTVSNAHNNWGACIADRAEDSMQESDTPLKALLKLTIALHEAGELTHANQ